MRSEGIKCLEPEHKADFSGLNFFWKSCENTAQLESKTSNWGESEVPVLHLTTDRHFSVQNKGFSDQREFSLFPPVGASQAREFSLFPAVTASQAMEFSLFPPLEALQAAEFQIARQRRLDSPPNPVFFECVSMFLQWFPSKHGTLHFCRHKTGRKHHVRQCFQFPYLPNR